jgi:hypothetical protein
LLVGKWHWPLEKAVFLEMLYNREKVLAFNFSHIRKISPTSDYQDR